MIRPKLLTVTDGGDLYIGEQEYESAGDFVFEVPLSVKRIHACCIGAGGRFGQGMPTRAGSGGGLAWANDIEVTPGEKLQVAVGASSQTNEGGRSGIYRFVDPDDPDAGKEWIMYADGGAYQGGSPWFAAGVSGGGGTGGEGSGGFQTSTGAWHGGGGGAGGYTGNGGNGWTPNPDNGVVSGGLPGENSGGGSGGQGAYRSFSGTYYGNVSGGPGGGVGVRGRGATAGSSGYSGANKTGRPGLPGSGGEGVNFGGGESGKDGANGGNGAVRIIWGIQYSYPDNADVTQ